MATLQDYAPRYSGDSIIDAFVMEDWYRPYPWPEDGSIEYAFMSTDVMQSRFGSSGPDGVTAMNATQVSATDHAMSYVSSVLNLPVVKVDESQTADIYFAGADLTGNTAGVAYTPYNYFTDGNGTITSFNTAAFVYLDISDVGTSATDAPAVGNFGYEVLLHEIGHALGLGHPFYEDGDQYYVPIGSDHTGLTIMSYTDGPDSPYSTFNEWDLAALRFMFPSMSESSGGGSGSTGATTTENGLTKGTVNASYGSGGATATVSGSTVTVTTATGTITYENVDRLAFSNGTLAFDIEGAAGQAYRLYEAAFNRTPDTAGLGFHIGSLDNGAALQTVANTFVNADEFTSLYGALDDAGFIDRLYQNVLERAADDGGKTFWLNSMGQGYDRAYVLMQFSESPENKAGTSADVADGIFFT